MALAYHVHAFCTALSAFQWPPHRDTRKPDVADAGRVGLNLYRLIWRQLVGKPGSERIGKARANAQHRISPSIASLTAAALADPL